MSLYGKSIVWTDIPLKLHSPYALEELLKGSSLEFYELDKDSFCRRQADIGTGDDIFAAREAYFSVADLEVSAADLLYFVFKHAFQTEMAWTA